VRGKDFALDMDTDNPPMNVLLDPNTFFEGYFFNKTKTTNCWSIAKGLVNLYMFKTHL
jgi:hypothetical protein